MPSERLRRLEVQANEAFDTYREMYFEGGISSVYLWDLEKGFAAVILIKKGVCPVPSWGAPSDGPAATDQAGVDPTVRERARVQSARAPRR